MRPFGMTLALAVLALGFQAKAFAHEMQHGFILSENDTFASHLVATGHHSRQVELVGRLAIRDANELTTYQTRKKMSTADKTYFLFQAQQLDLPNLRAGRILFGHIVESKIGGYEPGNIIVKTAAFQVQRVLLNIENPFFGNETRPVRPFFSSHLLNGPTKQCSHGVSKQC